MASVVSDSFMTLWTVAHQAPLSMATILEWAAMPSSRGIFPTQGSNPHLLHLLHWQMGSLPLMLPGKPIFYLCWWINHSAVSNSCFPMDCSPPGSSVHGISQARILEWVAISFSRGSSWPRDQTWVSCIAGGFFTYWTVNWLDSPCCTMYPCSLFYTW